VSEREGCKGRPRCGATPRANIGNDYDEDDDESGILWNCTGVVVYVWTDLSRYSPELYSLHHCPTVGIKIQNIYKQPPQSLPHKLTKIVFVQGHFLGSNFKIAKIVHHYKKSPPKKQPKKILL
jgi:hypothetical protein